MRGRERESEAKQGQRSASEGCNSDESLTKIRVRLDELCTSVHDAALHFMRLSTCFCLYGSLRLDVLLLEHCHLVVMPLSAFMTHGSGTQVNKDRKDIQDMMLRAHQEFLDRVLGFAADIS